VEPPDAEPHVRWCGRAVSVSSPYPMTTKLADRDCEYFCLLLLDSTHRLLRFVELFRGTIDSASVHPREVVKTVLDARAAAAVLVHNHPSQGATQMRRPIPRLILVACQTFRAVTQTYFGTSDRPRVQCTIAVM
jgi:DNA repair protein RadC